MAFEISSSDLERRDLEQRKAIEAIWDGFLRGKGYGDCKSDKKNERSLVLGNLSV